MKKLSLYTVDSDYVNYLCSYSTHLYREKKDARSRKYIGIVLTVNNLSFFAPLTSFKKKHLRFSNSIDFIKIGNIAAINLNKMFPVPDGLYSEVIVKTEANKYYRNLLYREQRFIQKHEQTIRNNACVLYAKVTAEKNSKLAKRSNDFLLLEAVCKRYHKGQGVE